MTFQEAWYTPPLKLAETSDHLTILKSGFIRLSNAIVAERRITPSTRASLFWDDESNSLAIVLTDGQSPGSFPLRIFPPGRANTVPRYIDAQRFFRTSGINPGKCCGGYKYDVASTRDAGISEDDDTALVICLAVRTS